MAEAREVQIWYTAWVYQGPP